MVAHRSNSIVSARVRDGKVTLNVNLEKIVNWKLSVKGKSMSTHNCSPIWTIAVKSCPSIYRAACVRSLWGKVWYRNKGEMVACGRRIRQLRGPGKGLIDRISLRVGGAYATGRLVPLDQLQSLKCYLRGCPHGNIELTSSELFFSCQIR